MNKSYKEMLLQGQKDLEDAGIYDAKMDAWLLLQFVTGISRAKYLMDPDVLATKEQVEAYEAYIEKRNSHYPLQYITHSQEFMGLDFYVDEAVLIPRQDTEILVEIVLEYATKDMSVLDMCTGSGCIIVSLAVHKPLGKAVGVDLSEAALKVAKRNGHTHTQDQVEFIQSDLFEGLDPDERFDIIVSNPPYIESDVIPTLMPEVHIYEPEMALDGTKDGLAFYRKIVKESRHYLKDHGMLFFEIGYNQGEAVASLMRDQGFLDVEVKKDLAGMDRVVLGRLGHTK